MMINKIGGFSSNNPKVSSNTTSASRVGFGEHLDAKLALQNSQTTKGSEVIAAKVDKALNQGQYSQSQLPAEVYAPMRTAIIEALEFLPNRDQVI